MMHWVVGSSIKFARVVVVAAVAVTLLGIWHVRDTKVDVLPEFGPPVVQVQTEALGLSAVEVEQLITLGLEQDLLNGLPWLDVIRSESRFGLSTIDLIFEPGADLFRARQMVQERLTQAHALPNVSSPPQMIQPLSSTTRTDMIGLSSETLTPIELSVLARWTVRPRLMGLPGVANVAIWGQRDQQLQVQVDPARLQAQGVTLDQVIKTTGNSLAASQLTFLEASTPGTGGFVDTPNQRIGIEHILPISTAEKLAAVPVDETAERSLKLGDVATVVQDHQPLVGDAVGPQLMLVIEKLPGAHTEDVTKEVDEAMDALRPGLSGVTVTSTFRAATYVRSSVHNVGLALLIGGLLLLVGLVQFLFDWRRILISFFAVTTSLAAALLVFYFRDAPVNMMVLVGLVAALALVIDDAIGDGDNIARALVQDRDRGDEPSAAATVLHASLESRRALAYAALICVVTVVPIYLVRGLSSDDFLPSFALTYVLVLLASMVVALTLTPALSVLLLGKARGATSVEPSAPREPPLLRRLAWGHGRVLSAAVHRPRRWLAGLAVLLVGFALVPQLSWKMLPTFRDRDLLVQLAAPVGTSLPEMTRITDRVSEELRSIRGVERVGAHVGRAVASDQTVGINSSEVWVGIESGADYDDALAAIERTATSYPGIHGDVITYTKDRTRDVLTGAGKPIVVRVFGPEFGTLKQQAAEVRDALSGIHGIVDARVTPVADEPNVTVEVDLAKGQSLGIKPGDVRREMTALVSGITVGSIFEQQKVFDVVVKGTPDTRSSVSSIQNLIVDAPGGGHVRLGDVAQVRVSPTPSVINHESVSRSMDVTANVEGRSLDAVSKEVSTTLRQRQMPLEFHAELLGDFEEHQQASRRLVEFGIAAAIGVFLLLQAAFRSWRLAFAFFVALPLALVGGVVAAAIAGDTMSLGGLLGFVAVLTIAVRQGILAIRRYQHLESQNGETGADVVRRGTGDRFGPTIATAAVTALVLLPFVVPGAIAGLEIAHGTAVVILGGLVTSTLFTVLVVPVLFVLFGSHRSELEDDDIVRPAAAPEPLAGHTSATVAPHPGE